jgi:hypothetical protein
MSERRWPEDVFHLAVVTVMVSCIAMALADFSHSFLPDLRSGAVLVCAVMGALEAGVSFHVLRRGRSFGGMNIIRFRVIELGLLLVAAKVVTLLGRPWSAVMAEIRTWPGDPGRIIDLNAFLGGVALLLAWSATTSTLRDLARVGEPDWRGGRYVSPVGELATRFFWGGALLMVLVGLGRVDFSALLSFQRPSIPGVVVTAMVYFGLGLVMLGQVRFARLQVRWRAEEVPVSADLAGRWARYGLVFALVAVLMALVLPTRYGLGLLQVAGAVLEFAGALIRFFFYLLFLPLLWLMYLLTRHTNLADQEPPVLADPPQMPGLFAEDAGGSGPGWLETMRAIVFWIVLVGAVVYLVRNYLRDRPQLMEKLRGMRPVAILRSFLGALWRRLTGWVEAVGERLPRREQRGKEDGGRIEARFQLFRPGALAPRERVLFYYRSVLHRAARRGLPRHPTQTPYEYESSLAPHLPEAEEDVRGLTDAFVEARYSRHDVDRGKAEVARHIWRRVRAALHRLVRDEGS